MQSGYILMVDDNIDILEAMQMAVEMEGYSVKTAQNGVEALALLNQGDRPSLILLDLMMPVMDGWAFAKHVEENKEFSNIPIVVVSAYTDVGNYPRNASGTFQKPIELNNLLKTVKQYCSNVP